MTLLTFSYQFVFIVLNNSNIEFKTILNNIVSINGNRGGNLLEL